MACKCKSKDYGYHREDCDSFDVYGKKKELKPKWISFEKVLARKPSPQNPLVLTSQCLTQMMRDNQDVFPKLYHTIKIVGIDLESKMAHLINTQGEMDHLFFSVVRDEQHKQFNLIYFEDTL